MSELTQAVADALINNCYGYPTSEYIDGLVDGVEKVDLTEQERERLDIGLSCIGLGAALYVIETRHGPDSEDFCEEVLSRLGSRLKEAGGNADMINAQQEIIRCNREILQSDFEDIDEYTAGYLGMKLLEPVAEGSDNIDASSPSIQMWVFIFVTDVLQLVNTILDNAEQKYGFDGRT